MEVDVLTGIVILGGGYLIRGATAFLLKQEQDEGPLGVLAGILLSGLTAGGAALADVGNIGTDWKHVVLTTLSTAVAAGGAAAQFWSGRAVDWIHEWTDGTLHRWFGVGSP